MKLLVTGGAGFIGSRFIRYLLESRPDVTVTNLDKLTYAGNLENLDDVTGDPRYRFVRGDICDRAFVHDLVAGVDAVVNFAAESHVDRSIESDEPFLHTNVVGVQTLLRAAQGRRLVHVSTDEVYGELPWRDPEEPGEGEPERFTETSCLRPRSPYAASKAAADHLALAYFHTHGSDVVITRSPNNYGPYQFPEKLLPLAVTNALQRKRIPVYGDGLHVRDWLHVQDHCRGIDAALLRGRAGEVYNFGARAERTNLWVVRAVVRILELDDGLIEFVADRPGHDRCYAIDPGKAERELQWRAEITLEEGLHTTVAWYREHRSWWERAKSGEYQRYYERMYGSSGRHPPRMV